MVSPTVATNCCQLLVAQLLPLKTKQLSERNLRAEHYWLRPLSAFPVSPVSHFVGFLILLRVSPRKNLLESFQSILRLGPNGILECPSLIGRHTH